MPPRRNMQTISVHEINIEDGYPENVMYQRKIYALAVSYYKLARSSTFSHLLVTDFSPCNSGNPEIEYYDTVSVRSGTLKKSMVWAVDVKSVDVEKFIHIVERMTGTELPEVEQNVHEDIFQQYVIVEVQGALSRFRDFLEMKRGRIKVLTASDLSTLRNDPHLRSFFQRLQNELGGDLDKNNTFEKRYHLHNVLSYQELGPVAFPESEDATKLARRHHPAEYNEGYNRMLEQMKTSQSTSRSGPQNETDPTKVKEEEPLLKNSVDDMTFSTSDEDDGSDKYTSAPETASPNVSSPTPNANVTEGITLNTLIDDPLLTGTFIVTNAFIKGYLPTEEEPVVIRGEDSQLVLNDALELILCSKEGNPMTMSTKGKLLCLKYLRAGFADNEAGLAILDLLEYEDRLTEKLVRHKLKKLLNRSWKVVVETREVPGMNPREKELTWVLKDMTKVKHGHY